MNTLPHRNVELNNFANVLHAVLVLENMMLLIERIL